MTDRKKIHVMVAMQPDGYAFVGTSASFSGGEKWRQDMADEMSSWDLAPATRFYVVTAELPIPPLAETIAAKGVDDVEF
jgi:hypothetical protein